MKLNKTFGRIATTLVATAMLASVAVVPAMAIPFTDGTVDNPIGNGDITFTKELLLPTDSVTPTATFNFDIKPAEATASETVPVEGGGTVGVTTGFGNAITGAGTVQISPEDDENRKATATEGIDSVTATVTLNTIPGGFTDAGVYKYTIEEQDLSDSDYKDATEQLDLYLFVQRDTDSGSFFISGATIYNGTTKTDTYTNWYKLGTGETPNPDAQVGTVTVSKTVTGAMGSMNDEFTFTISSSEDFTEGKISINGGTVSAVPSNGQFTLKSGQTATITGLDAGSYTITETVDRGYTLASVTGGDQSGNGTTVEVTAGDTTAVGFTNNREAVSPTGLIMDIAPYVLLVVVAAAGCFVFLRKRRED